MAFREKISWLSFGSILLAFGPYFAVLLATGQPAWALGPTSVGYFILAVTLLTVVMLIGTIGLALTNLKDAQQPSDERDREITRRGSAFGYAVLLPALFCALGTLFFGLGQAVLVNAVLAAIVLAELVRYGTEIIGYRRA